MKVENKSFGLWAQTQHGEVAFFKKNIALGEIQSVFSHHEYHRLKQTHSDRAAETGAATLVNDPTAGFSNVEGDALLELAANKKPAALGVSTADCLPVMVLGPNIVAGIHAGWRGVENEIVLKTIRSRVFSVAEAYAFIGPHIQWPSFEVDFALGEKFKAQYFKLAAELSLPAHTEQVFKSSVRDSEKCFINLSAIARLQLLLAGIPDKNIWISNTDTKTDLSWASYRREGKNMGKNLSFVARPSR